MHYVVTGGCGFIGSHLVRGLLHDGHRVTVVDDCSTGSHAALADGARLIEADITTPGVMENALHGADGCFHLAAIASVQRCHDHWRRGSEVNVLGTIAVCEAAVHAGAVPVVFASSAAVYGAAQALPITESTARAPLGPYGLDKCIGEDVAAMAWKTYRLPSAVLRFFNVYGPGQRSDDAYAGVIRRFMDAARAGTPVTIYGDGSQTRDFIFVQDVVRAMRAAMERGMTGHTVYNVCTGHAISINALAEAIGEVTGTPLAVRHAEARSGDIRHSLGSPEALRRAFPLPAPTHLDEGLRALLSS